MPGNVIVLLVAVAICLRAIYLAAKAMKIFWIAKCRNFESVYQEYTGSAFAWYGVAVLVILLCTDGIALVVGLVILVIFAIWYLAMLCRLIGRLRKHGRRLLSERRRRKWRLHRSRRS